ncbi:MAG: UPF0158 family protein [Gemmatales bacterium]
MPVSLKELVGEWDLTSEMASLYLNKQTGELYMLREEDMLGFDDEDTDSEDDLHDWEREEREKRREIEGSKDWVAVPSRDTHEAYRVMERFCQEQDSKLVELLMTAISGKGAFRRFKDVIHRHGLEKSWYAYQEACATEELKDWLEASGIEYEA